LVVVLWLTSGWLYYLALWVLPSVTVLGVVFRIRQIAEHSGVEDEHELNATRTVVPTLFERMLIAPCGINWHLEHHLFPSVPFYNLPRLHKRLMQEEVFRQQAHITHSYTSLAGGVLAELVIRDKESQKVKAAT
jgi:fatty acid desaturase